MSPRVLLRSVLALDDCPHSIALGTSIGIFVGLTPSVGIQTILILAIVFLTRPFFYFNGTAAMASTYISNPLTMAPLYYFWYRLGAWFFPGYSADVNFTPLLQFEGLSGWWNATCGLAVQVGLPMLTGALLTAPIGAAIAYPLTHLLVRWFQNHDHSQPPVGGLKDIPEDVPNEVPGDTETKANVSESQSTTTQKDVDGTDESSSAAQVNTVALAR